MTPIEMVLRSFVATQTGKDAKEILAIVNVPQVTWKSIPLAALTAFLNTEGLFTEVRKVAAPADNQLALGLTDFLAHVSDLRQQTLDVTNEKVRVKTLTLLGALVAQGIFTQEQADALIALGQDVTDLRTQNGGVDFTIEDVQGALDANTLDINRQILRGQLKTHYEAALKRVNTEAPAPTLDDVLSKF